MRVIVCGSRLWNDGHAVKNTLNKAKTRHGSKLVVVSGGARGADSIAYQWTLRNLDHENTIKIDADWDHHDPDWCKCRNPEGRNYCPMAGYRRNQQMLDVLLDRGNNVPVRVLAFKDGFDHFLKKGGTEDMVRRALDAGVECFLYDGEKWQLIQKLLDKPTKVG